MKNIESLTVDQIDALKELINIGVGNSSASLNTLIDRHIILKVPIVKIMSHLEMKEYLDNFKEEKYASVTLPFKGDLIGNIKLLLSSSNAAMLADSFMGEHFADDDLGLVRSGVINEIGNIVTNAVLGSFCNILGIELDYIVPFFEEGDKTIIIPKELVEKESIILFAQTDFKIDELQIIGSFAIFFEMDSFKKLIEGINKYIKE